MKDKKMSIRISDVNWKRIHDRAERAGLSLTDYVTTCCLGNRIVVVEGLEGVLHQQKAIGRNLNQLTTLANMGRIKTVYLEELTREYMVVNETLSAFIRKKV